MNSGTVDPGPPAGDSTRARASDEPHTEFVELDAASRSKMEFDKLSAEREKTNLESSKLRAELLALTDQQEKAQAEKSKLRVEIQKLRDDIKYAGFSRLINLAQATVPAISIFASVLVAANSLEYQRQKDRSAEIAQQLFQFNGQIVDPTAKFKQRNAIAAVLSLREHSIPSLLANLEFEYPLDVQAALEVAILQLNEDQALRPIILDQLLTSIRSVTLRRLVRDNDIDIPNLTRYLRLWRECMLQVKNHDIELYELKSASANTLAEYLKAQINGAKMEAEAARSVLTLLQDNLQI